MALSTEATVPEVRLDMSATQATLSGEGSSSIHFANSVITVCRSFHSPFREPPRIAVTVVVEVPDPLVVAGSSDVGAGVNHDHADDLVGTELIEIRELLRNAVGPACENDLLKFERFEKGSQISAVLRIGVALYRLRRIALAPADHRRWL